MPFSFHVLDTSALLYHMFTYVAANTPAPALSLSRQEKEELFSTNDSC
jgi:hypothetical protein